MRIVYLLFLNSLLKAYPPPLFKNLEDQLPLASLIKMGMVIWEKMTPTSKNLFLQDLRNGITYEYRIQELAPQGADIAIIGTIDIILNTTSITDGSNEQEVTFDIYAVDRAGNSSQPITSPPLTIYK